ncbi:hypothetical protein BPOR_0106g00100 [Botrytis porri]|uniref:C2H2-type domain-containing protein n=1 Tax=Botrytis porri TaxID=87229 RepID=A0A4Z1KY88_9HELO|nr:hypothetical protein BPOR_0106g00100 [Botrytis porri]
MRDDQEAKLKRWALHNLGRPQNDFMAYMVAETGLQQEQINHWWDNHENFLLNLQTTSKEVGQSFEINKNGSGNHNLECAYPNMSDSTPIPIDNNVIGFEIAPNDGSSSEQPRYDSYRPFSTHSMDYQHYANRFGQSPQQGPDHSDRMSFSDTDSLPSMLSGYGSNSASNRSSGRTCGTTSTLFSVDETQETDPNNATPSSQHYHTMQPMELAPASESQYKSVDGLSASQDTTRNHILESTLQPPTSLRHDSSTNLDSKKLPDIPQNFTRYDCTRCGMIFGRKGAKGDWKRHEETKCQQQKSWHCMIEESAAQMLDTWSCTLCKHPNRNRNEMWYHLIQEHNLANCLGKPLCERSSPRKDKLRVHLKQYHALSEDSTAWEAWYEQLPERKAWGCGFCGDCLLTWDARMANVSEHYQKQCLQKPQWSLTNEIKGLLKQSGNWDVLTPWNTKVGHNEKFYLWSDDDALVLQRKLEYHEGTPQSLVEEAARIAARYSHNSAPKVWPLHESNAVRRAGDLLTKPLRKSPPKRRGGIFYLEPSVGHGKRADYGTRGNNYGGMI